MISFSAYPGKAGAGTDTYNEELFSRFLIHELHLNVVTWSKVAVMPHHHDGRIRVRWHRGERTLTSYIRHHHTGPSPGIRVWGAIRYMFRSPLVRIDGSVNRARYILVSYDPWLYPLFESCVKPYVSTKYCTTACCRYCTDLP
ncbi:uncharacterized protein TNCV_4109291 [Trichonephila clavipes]|nr:uncharacterized protein TNCV_4109291 [Trichonephila clavipes]